MTIFSIHSFKNNYRTISLVIMMVIALYFSIMENYVLFHTIVELFSIIIAFAVFIVTWNSRKMMDNIYLYFVGIAYVFFGILDLLHTLTYPGMNVISGTEFYANQLWVATRFLQASTLVIGFYVMYRIKKPNADLIFFTYALISLIIGLSILYWHIFPVCFIAGKGQTAFKIYAEYAIIFLLFVTSYLLYKYKSKFSNIVYPYLIFSIIFNILSEICFTLYVSNYSAANAVGHLFKLVSFFLIYKAIVETGFILPTALIFKNLNDINSKMDESNSRLQIALEAGSLGATEVELKTGIMTCNAQFKRHYGRSPDEEFNYPELFESMLPQYRDEVKELVRQAIANRSVYRAQYQVKWPDGSIHWINAHGKARYNENGEAIRMVGIVSDITERKAFEQRKDDFLSIASHELKTPMTTLKASLQLLNRIKDKPFSEMHVKFIEQANRSVETMSLLINDLLNINRLTNSNLELRKTRFDISKFLQQICHNINIESNQKLILRTDNELWVDADEHRIEQVIINFINNAVKYAADSKQIVITAELDNRLARIAVTDTGRGISEDKIPFLFERYYRAEPKETVYSGLGLGLYICAEIIKVHGGDIGVNSEVGKGSSFWFTLPLEES
ncbi:MAG: PAS domain S-box protein [Pedobacter sp.]|nr:MAG: PAS domain S-box protein [Pedobacter sp.]